MRSIETILLCCCAEMSVYVHSIRCVWPALESITVVHHCLPVFVVFGFMADTHRSIAFAMPANVQPFSSMFKLIVLYFVQSIEAILDTNTGRTQVKRWRAAYISQPSTLNVTYIHCVALLNSGSLEVLTLCQRSFAIIE